jgi:hypothetical protein
MSAIAEVFRTHGAAYCAAGGDAVPARHRAVIDSITHCLNRSARHAEVLLR